jgi:hypothetical protein
MLVCWDILPCKLGCGYQLLGAVGINVKNGTAKVSEKWSLHNSLQLNILLTVLTIREKIFKKEICLKKDRKIHEGV